MPKRLEYLGLDFRGVLDDALGLSQGFVPDQAGMKAMLLRQCRAAISKRTLCRQLCGKVSENFSLVAGGNFL